VTVEFEDLRAAEAHIERLEEELLRLKDVKRDLQRLNEQHRRLQRSAEGRVAKLLSFPGRWLRQFAKRPPAPLTDYERWLEEHRVSPEKAKALREQSNAFSYLPLISILTPTFNPREEFLSAAVESVIAQAYPNWEMILVDDGSNGNSVGLSRYAERDSRIRLIKQSHAGISVALNRALTDAHGEWIALLDHDDLLEPDALFEVVRLLQNDQEIDLIYSDEDKIVDGRFASPMLKPDWSPEFFTSYDYLGHLVVMKSELAQIGFRSEFDGAQDYDLLLQVSEKTERIHHIPRVLYHWRRTPQSTAHNIRRKPGALEAGRQAVELHLARRGDSGRVSIDWNTHAYRLRRKVSSTRLTLVLVGGTNTDVERIRARTQFADLHIVTAARSELIEVADDGWLLLLDHDLEPLEPNWLLAMAEQVENAAVGAVGARILMSTGFVESAGLILLPNGEIRNAFAGFPRDHPGVNRQLQVVRNYTAVSASCLLTRSELVIKAGGFEHSHSWPICAGVNFCLKLRDAGFRTVSIPYADVRRTSIYTTEKASCPDLARRWPELFQRDPFYHPALSSDRADFSLAISPISRGKIQ
jgi:Glycosyltransferases involved in cell wall biogenesis